MTESTYISLFAVHQATSDVDAQIEFYKDFGFVVDHGYEPLEDVPDQFYTCRGVNKDDLIKTACMKVPTDPFMHLIFYEWKNLKRGPAWPCPFDQIGSRGMSMLVEDIESEVRRIKKRYPEIKFLLEPLMIRRRWGKTTTAVFIDTEDVQIELVQIEKGSQYDLQRIQIPAFHDMQWLHFMYNCVHYDKTLEFYQSFGMYHDSAVDFRPNTGFHPFGKEYYAKQWMDAFDFKQDDLTGVGFLRTDRDPSGMHLELMKYNLEGMTDPDDKPTWQQKGICRYCFRVQSFEDGLAKQKLRGTRIYVADQRGCLVWGDTQWFLCGDVDGNILTQEQWFPQRYWGEKE